jgi:hypothetical protein
MQRNNLILYTHIEKHYTTAAVYAARYQFAKRQHPLLKRELYLFRKRNKEYLEMNAMQKTVILLCIPFHFGTAIFEAMQLVPILQGLIFLQENITASAQFWLSVLAVCTMIGGSLLAGYCFHKITVYDDPVVPGQRTWSTGWLVGCIMLALIYIGTIFWLVRGAAQQDSTFTILYILVLLAILELVLSIGAVTGYTYISTYLGYQVTKKSLNNNWSNIYRYSGECAKAFRYYCAKITLYNSQNSTNLVSIDTPNIAEAISFHEGFFRPPEITSGDDGPDEDD